MYIYFKALVVKTILLIAVVMADLLNSDYKVLGNETVTCFSILQLPDWGEQEMGEK